MISIKAPLKTQFMNIQTIKDKILNGEMTDDELSKLITGKPSPKRGGGFLKELFNGFSEVYTEPQMLRIILNACLILVIILAIVFLSYSGKINMLVTTMLLSFVMGFLFGKIK